VPAADRSCRRPGAPTPPAQRTANPTRTPPRARKTRIPTPIATAASSSTVFPMPASPRTTRAPLSPACAFASSASIRASSCSRPTSCGATTVMTPPADHGGQEAILYRRTLRVRE
jgi:hypothetical protein